MSRIVVTRGCLPSTRCDRLMRGFGQGLRLEFDRMPVLWLSPIAAIPAHVQGQRRHTLLRLVLRCLAKRIWRMKPTSVRRREQIEL